MTSSASEMASERDRVELGLAHVPRQTAGMTPYEIMLSESQERMPMVAKAGREEEVITGLS